MGDEKGGVMKAGAKLCMAFKFVRMGLWMVSIISTKIPRKKLLTYARNAPDI